MYLKFLFLYFYTTFVLPMKTLVKLLFSASWLVFATFPLENHAAVAQQNPGTESFSGVSVFFNHLIINRVGLGDAENESSDKAELKFEPLTIVEENLARNLNSHWAWPEYTLEMVDSYSPFLFRTKKSQELEEVKILLSVNSKGRINGFEVLGEVDKGLKERLDHMIRKMPDCKPVPGYSSYAPAKFEMTIKK